MNELNKNKKLAELEALLFIYGEPISFKKISEVLEITEDDALKLVEDFKESLEGENRGLTLLFSEEKIQIGTKPEFSSILEKLIKKEISEDLTPASLETLALILYFSPISRSKIEYHRGVDSSFILKSLLLRGLIERYPDPKMPNTYLYVPSFNLLRHLGISKKENLPDYEKFNELNKKFEEGKLAQENSNPLEENLREEEQNKNRDEKTEN
jgi:segregation and condensation protein B